MEDDNNISPFDSAQPTVPCGKTPTIKTLQRKSQKFSSFQENSISVKIKTTNKTPNKITNKTKNQHKPSHSHSSSWHNTKKYISRLTTTLTILTLILTQVKSDQSTNSQSSANLRSKYKNLPKSSYFPSSSSSRKQSNKSDSTQVSKQLLLAAQQYRYRSAIESDPCYNRDREAVMCEPDFVAIAFQKPVQTETTCSDTRYCELPIKKATQQEIQRSRSNYSNSRKFDLDTATANQRKCHDCAAGQHPTGFLTDLNNYRSVGKCSNKKKTAN